MADLAIQFVTPFAVAGAVVLIVSLMFEAILQFLGAMLGWFD